MKLKVYDKKNEKNLERKRCNRGSEPETMCLRSEMKTYEEMYEKAPSNIQVVFPMQNGVISPF